MFVWQTTLSAAQRQLRYDKRSINSRYELFPRIGGSGGIQTASFNFQMVFFFILKETHIRMLLFDGGFLWLDLGNKKFVFARSCG